MKHLGSLWELLGSLEEILSSLWEPLWSLWEHLASLWKARRPESIRSMICDGVCVKVCDLGFDMNCFFGATLARGGCAHESQFVKGQRVHARQQSGEYGCFRAHICAGGVLINLSQLEAECSCPRAFGR